MRNEGMAVSVPDPLKGYPPGVPREVLREQQALLEKANQACDDRAQAARQARHQ